MANKIVKKAWTLFTETLGTSIVHPQSLLIKLQKEAVEEAKRFAHGKLVDIGCGRMPYRKEFEPLVESYTGVDHPEVSRLYKSEIKPDVLADAKKLPFKNNTFNTALLFQVLEHTDSPQEVISEAARILKKEGILIVSLPFLYPMHDMPYDWGRYTSSALKGFVEKAELRLIKLEAQGGFIEFWLQSLNTFLIKRINDIILSGLKIQTIIFLPLIIAISMPLILMNNFLIILSQYLLPIFPKYPNYFPLLYLLVAKKK